MSTNDTEALDPMRTGEAALRQLLIIRPDDIEVHNRLALMLCMQGRLSDAEVAFRHALSISPGNAEIHNNLGNLLAESGRMQEAEPLLRRAVELEPRRAEIQNGLGYVLLNLGRFQEAEPVLREANALRPAYVNAQFNLALTYYAQGRREEAQALLRAVLDQQPGHVDACNLLGSILMERQLYAESETWFRKALALRPESPVFKVNLGLLLLKMGRLAEGWSLYESRHEGSASTWERYGVVPATGAFEGGIRKWRGEPLVGKRMLIVSEQGFGDAIQFVRYMPVLKALGLSRLAVNCYADLVALFKGVAGIDRVVPEGASVAVADYDYWCFAMSVPLHTGIALELIPGNVPYVKVPSGRTQFWKRKLMRVASASQLKVGIVWAGNRGLGGVRQPWAQRTYGSDARRSIDDVLSLLPLLQIPDIRFVSLQKDASGSTLSALPAELRPTDWMNEVNDWLDTAAIVKSLDLVISVDTAVAHLAGALGKPVWLLNRFDGCWRWLHGCEDTPWYPTMRLFNQKQPGNWSDVIDEVARELAGMTNGVHSH